MKRFFSNPLNWLLLLLCMAFMLVLAFIAKVDYASDIPVEKQAPLATSHDIFALLSATDSLDFKASFPYSKYLDEASLYDILSLRSDLQAMDSIHKNDEMLNQEILSIALTEKLEERIQSSYNTYQPDTLIRLLQWAEKFNAYSLIDEPRATLYQVIYNHWLNVISNALQGYYEKDPSVKYNYKFRYLCDRLKEQQYSTPVKGTYFEKIIYQLIQKNGSYLFNKFWHATSIAYKLLVLLLVLIVIFPYIYIFKRSSANPKL